MESLFLLPKNKQLLWEIVANDIFKSKDIENSNEMFDEHLQKFCTTNTEKYRNLTEMNKQFINQIVKSKRINEIKLAESLPTTVIDMEDANTLDLSEVLKTTASKRNYDVPKKQLTWAMDSNTSHKLDEIHELLLLLTNKINELKL